MAARATVATATASGLSHRQGSIGHRSGEETAGGRQRFPHQAQGSPPVGVTLTRPSGLQGSGGAGGTRNQGEAAEFK